MNDFALGYHVNSLLFAAHAGAFTLTGNRIDLAAGITNSGTSLQTINTPIRLTGSQTWSSASGSLLFGGALDLGSHALSFSAAKDSGIAGPIKGTGRLVKTGAGLLVLGGNNTYSGGTSVFEGTLRLNASQRILDGSSVSISSGAVFDLNGFDETIGSLTGIGAITLGGGTLTAGTDGLDHTFAGAIGEAGGLTKVGAGKLTLSGNNTYTGATQVAAGTLQMSGAGRLSGSTAVNVASGASWNLNSVNQTVGSISGAGSIALGSATLTAGGDGTSTSFSGVIGGTGRLVKSGAGVLTLSGANTHSGGTTISGGVLQIDTADALAADRAVQIDSAGTLRLNAVTWAPVALTGTGQIELRHIGLNFPTLVFGTGDASQTFAGVIAGSSGTVQKIGSGTLTLTGASTHTAMMKIDAGTVRIGAAQRIGSYSDLTIASGAVLDLAGFDQSIEGLNGAGSVLLGGGTLGAAYGAFTGTISGAGGLAKWGGGTLRLSTPQTYAGATAISGGVLELIASQVLPDGTALSIGPSGTLDVNGQFESIGSLAGSGTVVMGGGILTVGGDNSSTTFSGAMYDGGELRKQGSGTLTVDASSYQSGVETHSVWVIGGTLKTVSYQALGYDTIVAVGAAGNLDLAGNSHRLGGLLGDGRVLLGGATLTVAPASAMTFSGMISGAGGFHKYGAGTLTLGGANTYTGGTTIGSGTLKLGSAERLPDSSPVSVLSGATLDLNGRSETVGSLSGAGSVRLSSGPPSVPTLTVGGNGSSITFSGAISGSGHVRKVGAGTWALSGANTYTGETRVDEGTLALGGTERLPNGTTVRVSSGATFDLRGFSETVGSAYFSGAMLMGGGTLAATQGLRVDPGGLVRGTGVINASLRNDGTVEGGSDTDQLDLRGSVTGSGNFTGNILLSGSYNPGDSPGVGRFDGDLSLAATSTLILELAGVEPGVGHDRIIVGELLHLQGGALRVVLLPGYAPALGDRFDLLDWGGLSGTFGTLALPDLPNALRWDTRGLYTDGSIAAVPEPQTWALLLAGLGLLAMRRKVSGARGQERPNGSMLMNS